MAAGATPAPAAGFGDEHFSVSEWVNRVLSEEDASAASSEPLDVRISVLLTKLQLQAAEVDSAVQEMSIGLVAAAPQVVREIRETGEQVAFLRTELQALLQHAASIEASSEAAVGEIRSMLEAQQRIAAADTTLRQAERVTRLLLEAESAFGRGDTASAAAGLGGVRSSLDGLGGYSTELFPQAEASVSRMYDGIEQQLRPALLQAITTHDVQATIGHAATCRSLGFGSLLAECYIQCRQGPIFEAWNMSARGLGGGGGGGGDGAGEESATVVSSSLCRFWSGIEETAAAEAAWLEQALPAEGVTLLPQMLTEAIATLTNRISAALSSVLEGGDEPERLLEALEASWAKAHAVADAIGQTLSAQAAAAAASNAAATTITTATAAAATTPARLPAKQGLTDVEERAKAAAVQLALLHPFDAVQASAPRVLVRRLFRPPPPLPAPPLRPQRLLATMQSTASALDASAPALYESASTVMRRLMPFGAALGCTELLLWMAATLASHAEEARECLSRLTALVGGEPQPEAARGAGTAATLLAQQTAPLLDTYADADADNDDSDEDEFRSAEEGEATAREALGVLRSVHRLRARYVTFRQAAAAAVKREARLQLEASLATPRQRSASHGLLHALAAAAQLLPVAEDDACGGRGGSKAAAVAVEFGAAEGEEAEAAREAAAEAKESVQKLASVSSQVEGLLVQAQRLALGALTAPMQRELRSLEAQAMRNGVEHSGADQAEEDRRAALLSFSAAPSAFMTQIGEHLLSLPMLLEPFATGETLTLLHPQFLGDVASTPSTEAHLSVASVPGSAPAESEADPAVDWIHAVAEATTHHLLDAVRSLPELQPLGAKQLAADVDYLANIFSDGLSLPQHAVLVELEALLSCDPSVLPKLIEGTVALPLEVAKAVAAKRGPAE